MPISSDAFDTRLCGTGKAHTAPESRPYPTGGTQVLLAMDDTPYYPPYMPDNLHIHNCLEIGLCLAGCGLVRLHDRVYDFSAGSLILVPRGVYHDQSNAGEPLTHWRYILIDDVFLLRHAPDRFRIHIAALLDSIAETGLFLENCTDSTLPTLIELMYELKRRDGESAAEQLELYVCLLMLELAQQNARLPFRCPGEAFDLRQRQPIEPALSYIYEHYQTNIPIGLLAKSCSMSESYFRKQFLRIMGVTPADYLNRFRIHRAMRLLCATSEPIQNIAARSGYASMAAFNRNFKRHAGVTPSEWRNNHITK